MQADAAPVHAVAMALVVSVFTIGCAPALDWRVVQPEASGVQAMMPCRPTTFARSIQLSGETVTWTLLSCRAGDAIWALGHGELADARSVPAALLDLRPADGASLRVEAMTQHSWPATGFTPHAQAGRWRWVGRLAGRQVSGETMNFASARKVYQATVVAHSLDLDAVDQFVASLRPRR